MRLWCLIALVIAGGGCAARYVPSPGSTAIAPGIQFAMPTGGELGYSVETTQMITAHVRDQIQAFQAFVSVTPDKIMIIAFDPFGGRALTVTATDDGIHSDVAPMVPAVLRPANILADLAIVYWPASAVRRGLAGSSATLYDGTSERTITDNGREIVHVTYDGPHEDTWTKVAHLRNIAFGYELDLQSTVTAK